MFCRFCGVSLPDDSTFCPACGRPLASVPASTKGIGQSSSIQASSAAAPAPAATPNAGPFVPPAIEELPVAPQGGTVPSAGTTAVKVVEKKGSNAWSIVRILFVICFTYVGALSYKTPYMGFLEPEVLGAWMGGLLIPVVVALIACSFSKKKRTWHLFTVWLFWTAFLLPSFEVSNRPPTETTEQRLSRLGKEAAGTVPIRTYRSSAYESEDSVMREYLKDVIKAVTDLSQAESRLDNQAFANLYSSASFGTAANIQRTIRAINEQQQINDEMTIQLKQITTKLKLRIDSSGWSRHHRESFWRDFEEHFNTTLQQRTATVNVFKTWSAATTDLYVFASDHLSKIAVAGGELVITDGRVRNEFNEKLKKSRDLYDAVNKLSEQSEQGRKDARQRFGLGPTEAGPKDSTPRK